MPWDGFEDVGSIELEEEQIRTMRSATMSVQARRAGAAAVLWATGLGPQP